jgi:hypothetical protein
MKKKKLIKQRVTWGFNPQTRVIASKKKYNRKREKRSINLY